ncbi:hypothetical protein EBN03_15475 [Nocardia stercoris]|uniref:Uncharacterized protein n=1 Tax=Nocardia stercoris TaxID=2483361 RepID=A0A3M2L4Q4_9NOCA|nr:hypothetical protein EBN03_15475 [Nocardia stercoris]
MRGGAVRERFRIARLLGADTRPGRVVAIADHVGFSRVADPIPTTRIAARPAVGPDATVMPA